MQYRRCPLITRYVRTPKTRKRVSGNPTAGASPRRSLRFRTANSMFSYIVFIKIEICFSKFLP